MTGYSDGLRRAANAGRTAAEPWARPTTVTVVVETWTAAVGTTGATLSSTASTTLSPRPRVAAAGDGGNSAFGGGFASSSAGGLVATEYDVGPITLAYPGGGYDVDDVLPLGDVTKEVYVILAGGAFESTGERFEVVPGSLVATRPHQFTFRVRRINQ